MSGTCLNLSSPLQLKPGDMVFDEDGNRILIVGVIDRDLCYVAFSDRDGVMFYRDTIRDRESFPDGYRAFRPT